MSDGVIAQIRAIQRMTVGELQVRWRELYGEQTRSRNKTYLWRRLAHRVQELQLGGLSDRAKQRIAELAPDSFVRACPPRDFDPTPDIPATREKVLRPARDFRLPPIDSVIMKDYKGRQLRVVVREDSFEFEGQSFESLSVLAKFIIGKSTQVNGRLFFGISERRRK